MHTSTLIYLSLALTSNAFPLARQSSSATAQPSTYQRRSAEYDVVNVGGDPDAPQSVETVIQTVTAPGAPPQTVTVPVPQTPTYSPSSSVPWGSSSSAYPTSGPSLFARGWESTYPASSSSSFLYARNWESTSSPASSSVSATATPVPAYIARGLESTYPASSSSASLFARAWETPSTYPASSSSAYATATAAPSGFKAARALESTSTYPASSSSVSPVASETAVPSGFTAMDRLARALGKSMNIHRRAHDGDAALAYAQLGA